MEIAQTKEIEYNVPLRYNEICALFNDTPINTGSKGRSLQLRKWQQYYDIEKVGMFYYIKKKYDDTELDLIENSGKYTTYITDRLLDYLSCVKEKEITLSFYDIYELTTMVNPNYHKGKNNLHTQDKDNEVQKFHLDVGIDVQNELGLSNERMISVGLYTFFKVSNKLLRQNVYNALKSMQRKGLIIFHDSFILYKKPVKSTNGEIVYSAQHICTNAEIGKILDFKSESLRYAGLSTPKELYCAGIDIQNKYYEHLLGLIKREFGYDSYTNAVKLILGNKAIEHELKFNRSNKLNENVHNQMIENKEMSQKIVNYLTNQFVGEYIDLKE